MERLGLDPLRVTDGPSGARGTQFTGSTSVCVPCGSALASTWDRDLVRGVGEVLGDEARGKGAGVLLAPTVNIHRHPLAGRNFECFSEDPCLTAELAVAYIEGVQSRGVGCCVKHFVANDQEHERMTISAEVDERTLREIYLPPFEAAVRRAGTWSVMSAYNRLGGTYCSAHRWLLTELLRDEWGFDGAVISDWYGTHDREAIDAGLDVEMPGPAQHLGPMLLERDDLDGGHLDRAAARVLGLMHRAATGRPEQPAANEPATDDPAAVARRAAAASIVLLRNESVLPLEATTVSSLAIIGPKAARPDIQGGGSAHVDPPHERTPLAGLTARAQRGNPSVSVHHEPGVVRQPPAALGHHELRQPGTDAPGLVVEYFATDELDGAGDGSFSGAPVHDAVVPTTRLVWLGRPDPSVSRPFAARARAELRAPSSGRWHLSLTSAGRARLLVDGAVVIDNTEPTAGESFFGRGSTPVSADLELLADQRYDLQLELQSPAKGAVAGIELVARPPDVPDALERAVAVAASADVAIVVAGTEVPDTEGTDRASMDLPADQVALIDAVARANPRTVVLLDTGSPVSLPWADDVAALAQVWYLGQEMGDAIADVVFGDADAAGRLPTTFPRSLEDTPAHPTYPGRDGRAPYDEGLLVGYRHYDRRGIDPRFCFGHGLSYTTFGYGPARVETGGETGSPTERPVIVAVDVTNTGDRPGTEVVQLYVRAVDAPVARPDRELRDFQKVGLAPGESTTVRFALGDAAFARWDPERHGWAVDAGSYDVLLGSSSRAIHTTVRVRR